MEIPGLTELEGAYDHFLKVVSEPDYARYSQWCRFDPRLAEIWVRQLSRTWETIQPLRLRESALAPTVPWPEACGLLLEFAGKGVSVEKKQLFRRWKDLVTEGFPRAHWEQFFIGQRKVAGPAMIADARFSTQEYLRWGYLGREVLSGKQQAPRSYGRKTRKAILQDLIERVAGRHSISVRDYWKAIDRSISLRQAERDLKEWNLLHPRGNTKGRRWRVRAPRAS